MRAGPRSPPAPRLGWREWVALPELGLDAVKAKVDTGARTSSLHAVEAAIVGHGPDARVRFKTLGDPDGADGPRTVEAPLLDHRWVRDSGGHRTRRPVVATTVRLAGQEWPIEVTLADRSAMGFPMLLGRQATRGRFSVDPTKSFLAGPGRPRPAPRIRRRPVRSPAPA